MRKIAALCVCMAAAAHAQTPELRNAAGVRLAVDTEDSNPALIIYVRDGPESERSSKVLIPEHVTVRAPR